MAAVVQIMKATPRFRNFIAFCFCVLLATNAMRAQSVTYTFEQFAPGTLTPISNASPDIGSAAFKASFTSNPNPSGFQVTAFQPNNLFSGNALFHPLGSTNNVLTITLNTAVTSVTLVFGSNGSSTLSFACSSGSTMVASTPQSGGSSFPGGTLTFSSATAFNSFTLSDGGGPEFAIDNLTMQVSSTSAVPDSGSTLLMLSLAGLSLLLTSRRSARVPDVLSR